MSQRRYGALWLFAGLLLAAVAIVVSRGQVTTDLSGFMPAGKTLEQRLLLQGLQRGPAARVILLGIVEGTQQDRVTTSRALADQLQATGAFTRVENQPSSSDLLGPDSLLLGYRYLLDPRPVGQVYSVSALRQALRQRLDELTSYGGSLAEQQLRADPTAAVQTLMTKLTRGDDTGSAASRWGEVWQSADQNTALLLLETQASGTELDLQESNLHMIGEAFGEVAVGAVDLQMSGAPVFAVNSRAAISAEVWWLSVAASVLLVVLLLLVYRSIFQVLMMAVPLVSGVLAGVAAVVLVFGEIHGIALAFGITLLGVAIDYPIHLYSHARHGDVASSAKSIWPTLRISVLTTTVGYAVLLLTDFRGLMQLGVFNLAGLISAAAVTRWVLPAISLRAPESRGKSLFESLNRWRLPGWLSVSSVLLILILATTGWWLRDQQNPKPFWNDSLTSINPLDSELLAIDQKLRQAMGANEISQALIITAADSEQVLLQMEAIQPLLASLVEQQVLGGYQLASDWLPSQATQLARQQALPSADQLLGRLNIASNDLGIRVAALKPFLDTVEASHQLQPLTLENLNNNPLTLRLGSLLYPDNGGWQGMIPLNGLVDSRTLVEALNQPELPTVNFVNLRVATENLLVEFRRSAVEHLLWGALVIALIIVLALRSVRAVFQVLLPIAAALLVSVAVLKLLGISLSLFHLIALLLVTGIGIDYALFFARSINSKVSDTSASTLQSISVSAASTLIVFGLLAQSSIPVLHMLGLTVAIGVCCSFVLTFIGSRSYA